MTPERLQKLKSVLNARQPDLTVITDFVHKQRNLSAIVRTADAVGIPEVHCALGESEFRTYRGTAKGSHQWVSVTRHDDISTVLSDFKMKGYQLVAADVGDSAVSYRDVDYTKPTALVLGAEKSGLSDISRSMIDQFVTVPMVGMVESFNVSVACGIILNEACYQRDSAGMYSSQRIDNALYQKLLFEWGHPRLAAFCQEKGVDYPAMREDGDIVNGPDWYASIKEGLS